MFYVFWLELSLSESFFMGFELFIWGGSVVLFCFGDSSIIHSEIPPEVEFRREKI